MAGLFVSPTTSPPPQPGNIKVNDANHDMLRPPPRKAPPRPRHELEIIPERDLAAELDMFERLIPVIGSSRTPSRLQSSRGSRRDGAAQNAGIQAAAFPHHARAIAAGVSIC